MTNNREETKYNTLVARGEHGDFIFLQDVFSYGPSFHGATGTRFHLVSAAEVAQAIEEKAERLEEFWQMSVAEGETTKSLQEWADDYDDDEFIRFEWDDSYPELHDQIRALGFSEEDYPVIACTGGGRMFPDGLKDAQHIYAPELVKVIEVAETK